MVVLPNSDETPLAAEEVNSDVFELEVDVKISDAFELETDVEISDVFKLETDVVLATETFPNSVVASDCIESLDVVDSIDKFDIDADVVIAADPFPDSKMFEDEIISDVVALIAAVVLPNSDETPLTTADDDAADTSELEEDVVSETEALPNAVVPFSPKGAVVSSTKLNVDIAAAVEFPNSIEALDSAVPFKIDSDVELALTISEAKDDKTEEVVAFISDDTDVVEIINSLPNNAVVEPLSIDVVLSDVALNSGGNKLATVALRPGIKIEPPGH